MVTGHNIAEYRWKLRLNPVSLIGIIICQNIIRAYRNTYGVLTLDPERIILDTCEKNHNEVEVANDFISDGIL